MTNTKKKGRRKSRKYLIILLGDFVTSIIFSYYEVRWHGSLDYGTYWIFIL